MIMASDSIVERWHRKSKKGKRIGIICRMSRAFEGASGVVEVNSRGVTK